MEKFEKEYYDLILNNIKPDTKGKEIVFKILSDLLSRKGLGNVFEEIDDDTQDELIQTWINIVFFNVSIKTPKSSKHVATQCALDWWHSLPIQDIINCHLGWANLCMKYRPEKKDCYHLTCDEVLYIYELEMEKEAESKVDATLSLDFIEGYLTGYSECADSLQNKDMVRPPCPPRPSCPPTLACALIDKYEEELIELEKRYDIYTNSLNLTKELSKLINKNKQFIQDLKQI